MDDVILASRAASKQVVEKEPAITTSMLCVWIASPRSKTNYNEKFKKSF